MNSIEVLLHPARMKIVQLLLAKKKCTAQELLKALPNVSQATLYRHINMLKKHNIIETIETQQMRGGIEHTYAVNLKKMQTDPEEIKSLSQEEHLHYFTTFLFTLLQDYGEYLRREKIDLFQDGVGYRSLSLYLDDQEFHDLMRQIGKLYHRKLETSKPGPGKKLRKISTIIMPVEEMNDE
ncbi:MAG: helix-turn-helix domain-containing protein [Ectobacillus sp.]